MTSIIYSTPNENILGAIIFPQELHSLLDCNKYYVRHRNTSTVTMTNLCIFEDTHTKRNSLFSEALSITTDPDFRMINLIREERKKRENIDKLKKIGNLKENWNGYGAKSFSNGLISKCIRIISNINIQPEIFPTGRESIQMEYEKENGEYLEFEVYEDHIVVLYMDAEDNDNEFEIEHDISRINEVIQNFYGEQNTTGRKVI